MILNTCLFFVKNIYGQMGVKYQLTEALIYKKNHKSKNSQHFSFFLEKTATVRWDLVIGNSRAQLKFSLSLWSYFRYLPHS